jgi:hypothetical protein
VINLTKRKQRKENRKICLDKQELFPLPWFAFLDKQELFPLPWLYLPI